MGRRGPAPKSETEKRTERVSVYLSDDELADLEGRAASAGLSVAAYLRRSGLESLPPRVPQVNREAWQELARVTGNLNQLARTANSGERVDADLRPVLEELRAVVQQLRGDLTGES